MTTKEHLTKHDREIAAIRLLLRQGMHLVVEVQQSQKRTEASIQRLEASVENLVQSLRRGGNGHAKRKVDLQ